AWPPCHLVDGVVAGVALVRPPKQPQSPPGRCLVLQAQPFQDDQGARPTSNTSVWQVDHGLAGWHLATSYGDARSSHPSLGLATCSADAARQGGAGRRSSP